VYCVDWAMAVDRVKVAATTMAMTRCMESLCHL
jgi:hypothetical protein